jgi:hypothetical protein
MNGPDKRTRRTVLAAAGVILLAAIVWLILLETHSYTRAFCKRINEYGYAVSPSDFYSQGYGTNTSIAEVFTGEMTAEELENAVELSKECGFAGDTDKVGTVEVMLWNMGKDEIMIVYLTDREPQLVFIENMETHEVRSIANKAQ